MTRPRVPGSPGQEHAAAIGAGPAGADGEASEEAPPVPPAMVRAAKLNAANMLRSLVPVVLVCVALVGWATFGQSSVDPVREVDPTSSVRVSAERADYQVLAPTALPDGYRPTSARTTAGAAQEGEPVTLEIGYLTPGEEFAGFVMSDDRDADALRQVLDGAEEEDPVTIDGASWDRVTTTRGETALTREAGQATVVVFGSATDEELAEVAASLEPYRG